MRNIKFRAFDKGNKIMHKNFQFIQSGYEGDDWVVFVSDHYKLSDNEDKIILNNPHFRRQFKIMQWTGQHDRRGKEIYEGDIIICRDGKAVIIYEERFGKFLMDFNYSGKNNLRDFEQQELNRQDADTCMRSIEVVGNIYEIKQDLVDKVMKMKTEESMSPEKVKPKGSAVGSNIYNGVLDNLGETKTKI